MSFLQPWLLLGLPLVALPIIIHLINQRRFQTVRWGAMMFLLTANRMARGLCPAPAVADHGVPHGGDCRPRVRDQPPTGERLAGTGGGRPARHDDHPARPLPQHAATRRERRGDSKLMTGRPTTGRNSQGGRFGPLGADREHDQEAPRDRLARCAADVTRYRRDECRLRYSGPARSGRQLHPHQQSGADRHLDLLRSSAGTTGIRKADVGRPFARRSSACGKGSGSICWPIPKPATGNVSVRVSDVRRAAKGTDAAELVLSLRLVREGGEDQSRVSVPHAFRDRRRSLRS